MPREDTSELKAVILAGGRGTRLKPITDYMPKPLIPIRNVPIIEWQAKYLRGFGIRHAIVCTGYRADMIKDYTDSHDMGVDMAISMEDSPLGTGGAIKNAGGMITGDSFLVMNGDVLTDIDIRQVINEENSIAAIRLRTKFGMMDIDGDRIVGFREKGAVPDIWMNAGIYHLRSSILDDLPDVGNIEEALFSDYARRGVLRAVKFPAARWHSIDSIKDMEECGRDMPLDCAGPCSK